MKTKRLYLATWIRDAWVLHWYNGQPIDSNGYGDGVALVAATDLDSGTRAMHGVGRYPEIRKQMSFLIITGD